MGCVAEALLQLPEVPLRSSPAADHGGPPVGLWLTVGLLAADGFALQLRLKKADKVRRREHHKHQVTCVHTHMAYTHLLFGATRNTLHSMQCMDMDCPNQGRRELQREPQANSRPCWWPLFEQARPDG